MLKHQPPASRVLLLKGDPSTSTSPTQDAGEQSSQQPRYQLLLLPNPSTGLQQQYVLTSDGLLEVNRVRHAASSWLVDQAFVSDGSAYLATPVNPVFVLLALLGTTPDQAAAAGSSMFQEAESLLCCEAWPDAQQLMGLAQQHLPCICDTKAVDDTCYYKPNSSKVLAFLRVFVQQTLAGFRSHSASSIAGLPDTEAQAYVIKFVREYISQAWFDRLAASYNLTPQSLSAHDTNVPSVRSAAASGNTAEKKPKVVDPKEAARKKAEESRAATAAAKLQKQAAGSKKISSFFAAAKKPK